MLRHKLEEVMPLKSVKATGGADPPGAPYCLVAWRDKDGSVHSTGPLPRARAETLVEVYGQIYPDETYWVQSMPPELGETALGRVGRPRRRTRRDEGH